MKKRRGRKVRTEAEIRKLIAGYESSGETRAAYCAARGVPVTTFDYYRRQKRQRESRLVEIDIREPGPAANEGLAVVLRNGRRVEIGWSALDRVASQTRPLGALLRWLEEA